jgi:hypothetical protein
MTLAVLAVSSTEPTAERFCHPRPAITAFYHRGRAGEAAFSALTFRGGCFC